MDTMIVGVDAGGTNVDAAVVGEDGVQETAKLPAEDVSATVLRDLFREISDGYTVDRVVVSTTRVLNRIVQDRLPSCSSVLVPGVGLAVEHAFAADDNQVVRGCIDHRGRVTESPVVDAEPRHPVVAVTAKFSPRNPSVEEEVAEELEADVVALGHEAGGRLDFPGRAATTAANARSKPAFQEFREAVASATEDLSFNAPVYVLRGDGSMVGEGKASDAPASTTRSGPASSSVGLLALSGERDAVCVDVGGTTTDVTPAVDGYPLTREGYEHDGFSTFYEGVSSGDLPLGGDTRVTEDGLARRREDYAAAFGGEAPAFTDALNVLGAGVGDTDASETAFADAGLSEADAETVVEEYVAELSDAVESAVEEAEGSPEVAVFGGALAGCLSSRLEEEVDLDVVVPEHADVCGAVGCAAAKVSVRTEVHVDSPRGRMTVSSVGSRSKSVEKGRRYSGEELHDVVVEETVEETKAAGGDAGVEDVEVLDVRRFNVVEDGKVEGEIADAVARVKPGIRWL